MSDSIRLIAAKQKLQWKIEKLDQETFDKRLRQAKELAGKDDILQEILFWIENLSKVGWSPTSIINAWAAFKSRKPAKEEVETAHG